MRLQVSFWRIGGAGCGGDTVDAVADGRSSRASFIDAPRSKTSARRARRDA